MRSLLVITAVVAGLVVAVAILAICTEKNLDGNQRSDLALLQAQNIAKAILAYRDGTGKYPDSLDQLLARPDSQPPLLEGGEPAIIDPWGKRFNFEVVTDEKGNERVVVWTTDYRGERTQWPRK
jgi:hypothetical protein